MKTTLYALIMIGLAGLTACGSSDGGSGEPQPMPVPVPQAVSAHANGAEMTITWGLVEGATGYSVYYALERVTSADNYAAHAGGTWIEAAAPPVTVTAEDRAAVYHFVVTARMGAQESALSDTALVAPRYEISSDGSLVLDVTTNLVWDRCLYGQQWDNAAGECTGDAQRIGYEAMLSHAQTHGRFYPQRRDLQTLVFCSTGQPTYFPYERSTPAGQQTTCNGDHTQPTIYTAVFPQSADYISYITASDDTCGFNTIGLIAFISMRRGISNSCTTRDGSSAWVRFYTEAS